MLFVEFFPHKPVDVMQSVMRDCSIWQVWNSSCTRLMSTTNDYEPRTTHSRENWRCCCPRCSLHYYTSPCESKFGKSFMCYNCGGDFGHCVIVCEPEWLVHRPVETVSLDKLTTSLVHILLTCNRVWYSSLYSMTVSVFELVLLQQYENIYIHLLFKSRFIHLVFFNPAHQSPVYLLGW